MNLSEKEQRMSDELFKQVHKYMSFQDNRQSGFGIATYRSAMRAFCNHVAKKFRLRNLNNISNKHLASFAQERQSRGIVDVKTEVSAVRKFHSRLKKPRYHQLEKDNKKLGLVDREVIKGGRNIVDRAWTNDEFKRACEVARDTNKKHIANALEIARYSGMRINEVTALTKSQVREGLEYGYFEITHTKGNVRRMSYVETKEYKDALYEAYHNAKSERVFQGHHQTHKQTKKEIQNFIYRHRSKWSNVDSYNKSAVDNSDFRVRKNLVFHGLRHAYARQQYRKNLSNGMTKREARKDVSLKLGHNRDEVTKVYL